MTGLSFGPDGFQCDFGKDIICLLESWPARQGDKHLSARLSASDWQGEMQLALSNN